MERLAAMLDKLLDKVLEFLNVLDLSFVAGGIVSLTALVWTASVYGALPTVEDGGAWLYGFAALFVAYVLGLVGFAAGRRMRRGALGWMFNVGADRKARMALYQRAMDREVFGDDFPYSRFHDPPPRNARAGAEVPRLNDDDTGVLVTFLWAGARTDPALKESMSLLRSYWVRAATYDSIATAMLVWAGCILLVLVTARGTGASTLLDEPLAAVAAIGALLAATWVSMREACQLEGVQADELVGSMMWYFAGFTQAQAATTGVGWSSWAVPGGSGAGSSGWYSPGAPSGGYSGAPMQVPPGSPSAGLGPGGAAPAAGTAAGTGAWSQGSTSVPGVAPAPGSTSVPGPGPIGAAPTGAEGPPNPPTSGSTSVPGPDPTGTWRGPDGRGTE